MDKNGCRNCEYFLKHFANVSGRFYDVLGCGHCLNKDVSRKEFDKIFWSNLSCNKWQPINMQTYKRMQCIQDALKQMTDCLEEIKQTLRFYYDDTDN